MKSMFIAGLLCACLSGGAWAQKSSSAPEAFLKDVNSLAGVSRIGSALLAAETDKKRWGDYCIASRGLAAKGEFREAIRMAARALVIGQANNNFGAAHIFATNDIATAYSYAGDHASANEWAEKCLAGIARGFESSAAQDVALIKANVLRIRALYLSQQARHDEALGEIAKGLDALPFSAPARVKAEMTLALAALQLRAARPDKASETLERVLALNDPLIKSSAQRLAGEIALARKDGAAAGSAFAAAQASGAADPYQQVMVQLGLARAARMQGKDDAAGAALGAALAGLESLRTSFNSRELRTALYGNLQSVFDESVDFFSQRGEWAQALNASEAGRARAMLDLQGKVVGAEADPGAARQAVRPLAVAAIQARLAPAQTMVVFHQLNDRLVVWALTRDSLKGSVVPLTAQQASRQVAGVRSSIEREEKSVLTQAQGLYQALLAPLHLAAASELVFVPHKALHLLPFQVLHDGQKWLIESHTVSTALSASLFEPAAHAGSGMRLAALGNPDLGRAEWALPGAEAEVRAIQTFYPGADVFVQKEASKTRLTEIAPGAGVVHVAAHAVVDEIDPMYSMIKLAALGKVIGSDMEAREFAALDLKNAQLVALSACNSGVGTVAQGDEFMGFKRALFVAGARSVLVSLWPVDDDSTRLLMTEFHQGWKTQSKAKAMQQAQIRLIGDARFNSPFYWAAFTLVGDPG